MDRLKVAGRDMSPRNRAKGKKLNEDAVASMVGIRLPNIPKQMGRKKEMKR